jgi:peptide/nickel transport system ATP-binding protein
LSLLTVKNLNVVFPTTNARVYAVSDVSFNISEGETFGIIGESGSGKSVISLAILKLLPRYAVVSGSITFKEGELLGLDGDDIRKIRGLQISLMPQNSSGALNPVLVNGVQISEAYEIQGLSRKEGLARSIDMMGRFLLKDPEKLSGQYPHQLSGGMKQRLLASISLSFRPSLLIADEPTKGLDPESRRKSIDLLMKIKKEHGGSMLLITHDLDLAGEICDRIGVMYSGEIVEIGPSKKIIEAPYHPYTQGLVGALPRNGLIPLEGQSPSRTNLPSGCLFHDRCKCRDSKCLGSHPGVIEHEGGAVRCHLYC